MSNHRHVLARAGTRLAMALVLVFSVTLVSVTASRPAAATTQAGPLTFNDPVSVDTPIFDHAITAISCPTASMCVVTGADGMVATSTNPTGGTSAWKVSNLSGTTGLISLSCPTTTLCVGADNQGQIYSTINPLGGAPTWSSFDTPLTYPSLSCPTETFCLAGDNSGQMAKSFAPTSGVLAWSITTPGIAVVSLDCPTDSFCVAGGNAGNVSRTSNASSGTPTWTSSTVLTSGNSVTSTSCVSTLVCVVSDGYNQLGMTYSPSGQTPTWAVSTVTFPTKRVSCSFFNFCVTVSYPNSVAAGDPAAISGWSAISVPNTVNDVMMAVDCPTDNLCVTGGSSGRLWVSTSPSGNANAWTAVSLQYVNAIQSMSCPTESLCVAVDNRGNVLRSITPDGAASAWTLTNIDGVTPLSAVSCPTTTLCVAVDTVGNIFNSSNPADPTPSWTKVAYGSNLFNGIDCPTTTLCVATDNAGNIVTTTLPTGDASAWTAANISTTVGLGAVSCASATACMVIALDGSVYLSTNPTGGLGLWYHVTVPSSFFLTAISCPSTTLCVATDSSGHLFTTTNPTSSAATWSNTNLSDDALRAVSCPTASFCVVTDNTGHVYTSTNPAGSGLWTYTAIDGTLTIGAISCATTTFCAAGDIAGNVIVTPIVPTPGMLRVTTQPALPSQISVDGHIADTWGLNWLKLSDGQHQVCFGDVPGFELTQPACQSVTITHGTTVSIQGVFAQRGYLKVETSPAVPSQITIDGNPADNWGVYTDLTPGQHQVCFGAVAGFDKPACQTANVTAGGTTTITGTFSANPTAVGLGNVGMLRVTTSPAVPSQISVDGHIADTWGLNWLELPQGTHNVCFGGVPGYTTPTCQTVTITNGQTTTISGTFTQRGFLKVMTSPAVPATITIDGHPADDWGVYTDMPAGSYQVCFGAVAGKTAPACQTATVTPGATTAITGTYS